LDVALLPILVLQMDCVTFNQKGTFIKKKGISPKADTTPRVLVEQCNIKQNAIPTISKGAENKVPNPRLFLARRLLAHGPK
jgi:hypothetical protein